MRSYKSIKSINLNMEIKIARKSLFHSKALSLKTDNSSIEEIEAIKEARKL